MSDQPLLPQSLPRPHKKRVLPVELPPLPMTVIGWQGISCVLPPEWNLTSFSMERENGYIRADAPGDAAVTVQIRWQDAAETDRRIGTLYDVFAPRMRKLFKRPPPEQKPPDLRKLLEKVLKDSDRSAKKAGTSFESSTRSEKIEGDELERTAIPFSWTGGGRGQGKIWHCSECNRVVVAQVIGISRDASQVQSVAAGLFATLHDHSKDSLDLWALYDLQLKVPETFRLHQQQVMSGHLRLVFLRGGEMIVVDRWGLASMTLKRFKPEEWLAANVTVKLKAMKRCAVPLQTGHEAIVYSGGLSLVDRLKVFRSARGLARPLAVRFEGGVWVCEEQNRIYSVQTLTSRKTTDLWNMVANTVMCCK